eukprot:186239-Prorocentrum_minimum.AAC.1
MSKKFSSCARVTAEEKRPPRQAWLHNNGGEGDDNRGEGMIEGLRGGVQGGGQQEILSPLRCAGRRRGEGMIDRGGEG